MPYNYLEAVVSRQPKKLKITIAATMGLLGLFFVFNYQRSISFSYSGQQCFRDITFLPEVLDFRGDGTYGLSHQKALKVKDYPLITTQSCVYALKVPEPNNSAKIATSILNINMPNKKFKVVAEEYPKLNTAELGQKISVREALKFPLDKDDKIFTYWLVESENKTVCQTIDRQVICPVGKLNLNQKQTYKLSVERTFDNQPAGTVISATTTTVEPIEITKSNVSGVVYDKPTEIIVTTNKNLISARLSLKRTAEDGKKTDVAHETTIEKNQIRLKLKSQLPRNASFELYIGDALADDKGILFKPYVLGFKTSGGPKVVGINIGSSSAEPGQTIVVNFDQNLATGQNLAGLINVNSGGNLALNISADGNRILLKPEKKLPICAKFAINISGNLINEYGVGGDSAWSMNSRIRCYTTSNIGYSVKGRAITAWHFGSGASRLVFFGATHGNEKSTKYLMDRWIAEIDANFDKVPAGVSITVIPNLNPDGFAMNSRRNANNVDLNRNFPANDWKKDVTMPSGELVINGGGTSALSEPESKAIANFVTAYQPRLVLTFHSIASIVSGNSKGIADTAAIKYSELSGYNYSAFGEEETVFKYDTNGAFETWMHDKAGLPTILVELSSHTASEFYTNRSAMWEMLRY